MQMQKQVHHYPLKHKDVYLEYHLQKIHTDKNHPKSDRFFCSYFQL